MRRTMYDTGLGMKEMKLIWNVSEQQVNEC